MAANLVSINQMKIIIQVVAACASACVGQKKSAISTSRCYGGAARRVLICPENGRLLLFFVPAHFGVHLVLLEF